VLLLFLLLFEMLGSWKLLGLVDPNLFMAIGVGANIPDFLLFPETEMGESLVPNPPFVLIVM